MYVHQSTHANASFIAQHCQDTAEDTFSCKRGTRIGPNFKIYSKVSDYIVGKITPKKFAKTKNEKSGQTSETRIG